MSQGLSDDQVGQELKKMTMFIKQEALEKAREIELKADEEFAIEKSKLVRSETASIDTSYEKKYKSAAMSLQTTKSTVANKTRLKVLGARQEVLDGLFEKAQGRLGEGVKKDGKGYEEIVKGLVLEGLYALDEDKVTVRARKADREVVEKACKSAGKEFEEKMGRKVEAKVDGENFLPEACAGGVTIVGGGGKIDINNTFEERLKLLQDSALPAVRTSLFGKNENRKFYD